MFGVGDRVKSIHGYIGVSKGELGTIQHICGDGSGICDLYVRWDAFNSHRHNNDGMCEVGHGWRVSARDLELVYEVVDLGSLPTSGDILSLFA